MEKSECLSELDVQFIMKDGRSFKGNGWGERILLIRHISLAVCMKTCKSRGMSLVVIPHRGDLITPCINKALWI